MSEEKRWLPCALAQAELSKGKRKLGQLWIGGGPTQLDGAPDTLKKLIYKYLNAYNCGKRHLLHHYACCDINKRLFSLCNTVTDV